MELRIAERALRLYVTGAGGNYQIALFHLPLRGTSVLAAPAGNARAVEENDCVRRRWGRELLRGWGHDWRLGARAIVDFPALAGVERPRSCRQSPPERSRQPQAWGSL